MAILEWLGLARDRDATRSDALTAVERELDALEPRRARYVAAFAYLLGRVARADHEVTSNETAAMERLLRERGGLPADQASVAVRLATAHGLKHGGTDDFLVARAFRDLSTETERLALLECLFAVSASDQSIGTVEDNEMRRIARELQISHAAFIEARAAHLAHLAVLRGSHG